MPPQPGAGQLTLEGVPQDPRWELEARCAFGRALTPRFYDMPAELLPERPAYDELLMVAPSHLEAAVFTDGPHSVDGIAWHPDEYQAMLRFPRAFGRAVLNKSMAASGLDPFPERRHDRAASSQQHAFDAKYEKMKKMMDGYGNEQEWLARLRKEMRTPGLAHMSLLDMRQLVTSAWTISFKGLLDTAEPQYDWDKQQRKQADVILQHRLFYAPQKSKLKYWTMMTDLALDVNSKKSRLVGLRLRGIEQERAKRAQAQ